MLLCAQTICARVLPPLRSSQLYQHNLPLPRQMIFASHTLRSYPTVVCTQNAMYNRTTATPSETSFNSYSNKSVCALCAICIAVCGTIWPFYSILGLSQVASSHPS